jgi:Xaa-Pro dipeptidase
MERVTIANQVNNARFEGHSDSETAAELGGRLLQGCGAALRRIGIETRSAGLPYAAGVILNEALP